MEIKDSSCDASPIINRSFLALTHYNVEHQEKQYRPRSECSIKIYMILKIAIRRAISLNETFVLFC